MHVINSENFREKILCLLRVYLTRVYEGQTELLLEHDDWLVHVLIAIWDEYDAVFLEMRRNPTVSIQITCDFSVPSIRLRMAILW